MSADDLRLTAPYDDDGAAPDVVVPVPNAPSPSQLSVAPRGDEGGRSLLLSELRDLHARWKASGLVYTLRFDWAKIPVVVGADRTDDHLGLRDLWWLSDLPVSDRPAALSLLLAGGVVESIAPAPAEVPAPPPMPSRRRRV